MPNDDISDPLTTYQRSAVQVERSTRATHVAGIAMAVATAVLLVVTLITVVSVVVSYGGQVKTIRQQLAADHATSATAQAKIVCETNTLNLILTELAKSQTAVEHRQKPPVFVYPKPC